MSYVSRQYISLSKMIFILGEGLFIFGGIALGSALLVPGGLKPLEMVEASWMRILLVVMVIQVSLYLNDMYENYLSENFVHLSACLIQSVGAASIVLSFIYFLWPSFMIGRWVFLGSIVLLVILMVLWRVFYLYVMQKRLFTEKAIILGDGELAKDIFDEIGKQGNSGYQVKYVFGGGKGQTGIPVFNGVPVRKDFHRLGDIAKSEGISSIIVALDQRRGVMPFKELLDCKVRGITIVDGGSFYERTTGRILVERINPSSLIFCDGFRKQPVSRIVKRLVGVLVATVLTILLCPFMIVIALAIKLDSQGPVIFCQERVGENGKIFTLYKFRSMKANAERESGPVWAQENDPRITRVGKVLRKLRLDELPQVWNVLKGDMSFVGPRPERPHFVNELKQVIPYYEERLSVKPGVTGWAQIKYPYGANEHDAMEKLKYDLYYIKNMSILLDMTVIFHTAKIVLLGRGSR